MNRSRPMLPTTLAALLLALAVFVTACATESADPEPLEIQGVYVDEFTATQTITEDKWSDSYGFAFYIMWHSNESNMLVARNSTANVVNGGLYSRFDWTESGGDLYYCQTIYNAVTVEETFQRRADAEDLAGGCSGFAWTNLTP